MYHQKQLEPHYQHACVLFLFLRWRNRTRILIYENQAYGPIQSTRDKNPRSGFKGQIIVIGLYGKGTLIQFQPTPYTLDDILRRQLTTNSHANRYWEVISLVNHTSSFHLFFKLTNEPLKCLKQKLSYAMLPLT